MRRSFCLYIPQVQPTLCFTRYIRQRGVFVSQFIFLHGVCRYQMYDERDKSLRFSCIYNQAQFINADFGRLIGNMDSIVYGRG